MPEFMDLARPAHIFCIRINTSGLKIIGPVFKETMAFIS